METNDAVSTRGRTALTRVPIRHVKKPSIGRQVEIGCRDAAIKAIGLGHDILKGLQRSLLGIPLPDAYTRLLALVAGVDDR